jgi:hypothetical protein
MLAGSITRLFSKRDASPPQSNAATAGEPKGAKAPRPRNSQGRKPPNVYSVSSMNLSYWLATGS